MMMPTRIRSQPSLGEFTPLAEHQEQTPQSFYGGKPVLHYHTTGAKAWIPASQRGKLPFFPADLESSPTAPEGSALNGTAEENVEQKVDLYVNSQTFTVFCPASESGLSIPYPLISIHAIKTIGAGDQKYQSIYLQLELSEGSGGTDDDFETVELTIIPPTPSSTEDTASPSEIKKLFNAISDCSDLNPDPAGSEDEDEDDGGRIIFEGDHEAVEGFSGVFTGARNGGLPAPMPGSSGWITAENMHEYFDADGNWIGGGDEEEEEEEGGISGELGDGAGAVHAREEEETVNGQEADENKRARRD
ncbi:regulator of volume decrease after cellular swelling-domain-containing protein [Cercophora scortea]|uniref:Regulator of volume decrease after cellular swelling-domain-containing protein n=1 Tax=Cercophora scortea TaxID=314031 RepID=A0AAE0INK4_9PEZI|nr:regulator of volume decrease after cellular swelling-domain-containing protein [Cercophora scortea]